VTALKLTIKDLWYEATTDKAAIRKAMALKRRQACAKAKAGRVIDATRMAEDYVRSRRGIDIAAWSDARLDREMAMLATAYTLLLHEDPCYGI
jgi:hypothetical protein